MDYQLSNRGYFPANNFTNNLPYPSRVKSVRIVNTKANTGDLSVTISAVLISTLTPLFEIN